MTKRESSKQVNRVHKLFKKWMPLFQLGDWDIQVHYESGLLSDDPGMIASAHASWEYARADLYFSLSRVTLSTDEELEETVVHELVHVHLKEMQSWKSCDCEKFNMAHEERVCTQLARVIMTARNRV